MPLKQIGLVAALCAIGSARSFAQSDSPSNIQSVLKSMNVPFVDSTKEDATTFGFTLDGQSMSLVASKADLRLSLTVSGRAQFDRINLWNAQHRFARAYIDSEGAPHLDADLDVSTGVTRQGIQAFVTTFGSTARLFATEFSGPSSTVSEGANKTLSKTRIGLPYGDFALSINPKEWQQAENRGGTILFRQVNGDGYAMVITEPAGVPNGLSGLKTAILNNTKKNVPDLKVTLDDKRTVAGHEVLVLGMEGTVSGVSLRYLNNAYSGPSGTIQVLTYTGRDVFEKNLPIFTELLNGLEINESSADSTAGGNDSGPGRLTLSSGKAVIDFDKSKWKVLPSSQVGRYMLTHSSGDAYAQVIWEGLVFPLDTIADVGLGYLKREDPNPTVTFKRKLTINGNEMSQMNVDATVRGLMLSYRNYYYSGKAGTIQIMTWTKQDDMAKYEKELTNLLNGFHVTE